MEIIPLKIHVNRPLVQSDEMFMQIQELIDKKRQFLIDKQKKLKHITKQNVFLDSVKNDYINYYNYISQQKQDQIKALELLNNYIDDLTSSGKLSEYNIEDAKFEQHKILHEVKSIKSGLDSIINTTTYLNAK